MSTITLTGLTEIERARIRYALVLDEATDYDDDPFLDGEMDLELSLPDLVELLTTVQNALYAVEVEAADEDATESRPTPEKRQGPRADPSGSTGRKNISWKRILLQLLSGEIDEFTHTGSRASVKSARAMLLANYAGVDVVTQTIDSETARITLKIGSYQEGE